MDPVKKMPEQSVWISALLFYGYVGAVASIFQVIPITDPHYRLHVLCKKDMQQRYVTLYKQDHLFWSQL